MRCRHPAIDCRNERGSSVFILGRAVEAHHVSDMCNHDGLDVGDGNIGCRRDRTDCRMQTGSQSVASAALASNPNEERV
jgi:hypothetical protein